MAAVSVTLSTAVLAGCGTSDPQEDATQPDLPALSVTDARIHATTGEGTAFLTMSITSNQDDALLRASTDPSVAASITLTSGFTMPTLDSNDPDHQAVPILGEEVTEVALPAGEVVEFGATGYGLVLNDTKALVEGETATIHLELTKAGTVDIVAPITVEQ